MDGDKWKTRVKRLECALRHGAEKMAYFGHYEDEHDDKNDLPHDFTKQLAAVPAHLVKAAAQAHGEIGDDGLEEYAKARDKRIDEMIGVFMELTHIYMVRGARQSAVEIAKMVMDLDNVSLESAERIRDKLRRSVESEMRTALEDGSKPMGIARGIIRGIVLSSKDDTESRPGNGCVDCLQRDGQRCSHPDRPGLDSSKPDAHNVSTYPENDVSAYLENALLPGSPVIPRWCPMGQDNRKRVV